MLEKQFLRYSFDSEISGFMLTASRSAIIDKLEKEVRSSSIALAFMFCNYNEIHGSQTLENLLGSLIREIVQSSKSIPADVLLFYGNCRATESGPGPSIEQCSEILGSIASKLRNVYIVIDALDEYEEPARITLIEELFKLPENVRILCTSRHPGDIEELFQGACRLEIRASDSDVSKYIQAKISEERTLKKFCKEDTSLEHAIIESIVKKADGMSVNNRSSNHNSKLTSVIGFYLLSCTSCLLQRKQLEAKSEKLSKSCQLQCMTHIKMLWPGYKIKVKHYRTLLITCLYGLRIPSVL